MPALVGVAGIALIAILLGYVMLGMLHGVTYWFRSWIGQVFSASPKQKSGSIFPGNWKYLDLAWDVSTLTIKAAKAVVYPFKLAVQHIEHTVTVALSRGAALNLPQMTRLLRGIDAIVAQEALHIKGVAFATYQALSHLRHVTVPRLIREAIAPVLAIANQAHALAVEAENRLTAARDGLTGALGAAGVGNFTTLANALSAFVNYTANLHSEVWTNLRPDVIRLTSTVVPQLTRELGRVFDDLYTTGLDSLAGIRLRLRNLEDTVGKTPAEFAEKVAALAGTLAVPGVLAIALTKVWPDLFCRNTKGVTKKLCGLDNALIDSILGLSLAFLVVIDPVAIAEAALAVEGEMEPIIHQVAA